MRRPVGLMCALIMVWGVGCSQGSGVLKRDQRALRQGFEHVNSSCEGAALKIEQRADQAPSLQLSADDDVLPDVRTLVTNETLYISCGKAKSSQNPIVIEIAVAGLQSVITKDTPFLTLEGLESRELRVGVTGSTVVKMQGRAQSLRLEVNSASQVQAQELEVQEAMVLVSPASWVDAQTSDPGYIALGAVDLIDLTMSEGLFLVVREPKTWEQKLGPEAKVMAYSPQAIPTSGASAPSGDANQAAEPEQDEEDKKVKDAIDKALGY